jgi:protein polybromo-1
LRPGRKSFNELRELYKNKLLEIFKAVVDLKVNGRQVCAEFMFRPDPHRYPDYYNVIENPIDMVTMRHRIENGEVSFPLTY